MTELGTGDHRCSECGCITIFNQREEHEALCVFEELVIYNDRDLQMYVPYVPRLHEKKDSKHSFIDYKSKGNKKLKEWE